MDTIATKFAKLGGKAVFGDPVGKLETATGSPKVDPETKHKFPGEKVGELQHYQHGVIAALADADAFGVYGPIFPLAQWTPESTLGWPIGDSQHVMEDGKSLGWFSRFQHRSLYLADGQKAAVPMEYDAINSKYSQLGGPAGLLKFPQSARQTTSEGSSMDFQNGAIFVSNAGAHEVHGLILGKYRSLGAEKGSLGFPISDERTIPGTADRYSDFENGVILWNRGAAAATQVNPVTLTISGQALPIPPQFVLLKIGSLLQEEIGKIALPSRVKAINIAVPPTFRIDLPDPNFMHPTTGYAPGIVGINRRHKTRTMLVLVTDWPAPNFDITLDLDLLVYFDHSSGKHGAVMASIYQWWYTVKAPFPAGQSDVDLVGCKLEAAFKPLVGSPRVVFAVPDNLATVNILAVKTMQDGSINVFVGS